VDAFWSQSIPFRPQQKKFSNERKQGYALCHSTGQAPNQNLYKILYQGPDNNSRCNNQIMVFCQRQGHQQEECRKRIKANKPCFNAFTRRAFWPKINLMDPNTTYNAPLLQPMGLPLVDFHLWAWWNLYVKFQQSFLNSLWVWVQFPSQLVITFVKSWCLFMRATKQEQG